LAHLYVDRVKEVTTSTGPGALTLGGAAPGGYATFASALAVGDTTDVCIEDPASGEWEVCQATLVGPTTLQRGAIHSSSVGGARISFAGGTKHVFITLPAAEAMRRSEIQAALAAKAAAAHTHSIADVTGLQAALDGKAAAATGDEAAAEARVVRVTIGISGTPDAGEVLPVFVAPYDLLLPAGLAGSVTVGGATAPAVCAATAATAAAATSVVQLRVGGSMVPGATLTFAAAATTATRGTAAATTIPAGTTVYLVCPNPADAALADIAITLAFIRGS
jgi:hypothetical protein